MLSRSRHRTGTERTRRIGARPQEICHPERSQARRRSAWLGGVEVPLLHELDPRCLREFSQECHRGLDAAKFVSSAGIAARVP